MTLDELIRLQRARALAASGGARALRLRTGLSQRDIARCIGVCSATIHQWERGNTKPQGERAVRWIELLDRLVPPSDSKP